MVLGPAFFIPAPAIGGTIGAWAGLSGAAASSHGLAVLGGGAVAAGGYGMAGGTVVVTATGASLGGALGASVTTAYCGSDRSFAIGLSKTGTSRRWCLPTGSCPRSRPLGRVGTDHPCPLPGCGGVSASMGRQGVEGAARLHDPRGRHHGNVVDDREDCGAGDPNGARQARCHRRIVHGGGGGQEPVVSGQSSRRHDRSGAGGRQRAWRAWRVRWLTDRWTSQIPPHPVTESPTITQTDERILRSHVAQVYGRRLRGGPRR